MEIVQYDCRDKNLIILVVKEGERLCMWGACSILCLAGNATINDYKLQCTSYIENKLVFVSAPQRMGMPAVIDVKESDAPYKHSRLKFRIKEIAPNSFERIMYDIGPSSPAVFVINKELRRSDQCVREIIPNFFVYSNEPRVMLSPRTYVIQRMDYFMYEEVDLEKIQRILTNINDNKKENKRTVLLPVGNKGAGKSTFVRNMINRILNNGNESVYVLDCDIGQSEFTPCGCISLTKVNEPIFDLPYNHQLASFENTYFYGDITVKNIKLYMNCFEMAWNKFISQSEENSICIINTMGWIEDLGYEIIMNIVESSQPGHIVELYRDLTTSRFIVPDSHSGDFITIRPNDAPYIKAPSIKKLIPPVIREMTILGYFSSLLQSSKICSIVKSPPFRIPLKKASIILPADVIVNDEMILSSLNLQIVALCFPSSDIRFRRICNNSCLPEIAVVSSINDEPMECVGYAIVRGVSYDNGFIYVMTTVHEEIMKRNPTLVRGCRIATPSVFYNPQFDKFSPYTVQKSNMRRTNSENLDDLYNSLNITTSYKRSRLNH